MDDNIRKEAALKELKYKIAEVESEIRTQVDNAKSDAEAAQDRYIWADGHCRELEDKFTIVGEVTVTQNPPVVEPDYEPSVLADGSLNPDGEYRRMR